MVGPHALLYLQLVILHTESVREPRQCYASGTVDTSSSNTVFMHLQSG